MLDSLIVEHILAHEEKNVIFRTIVFGNLSRQNGIRVGFMLERVDESRTKLCGGPS